jgi:hypothetical protein
MSNRKRNARLTRVGQQRFHKTQRAKAARVERTAGPYIWYVAPFGEIVTEPMTVIWGPGERLTILPGPLETSKEIVQLSRTKGLKPTEETDGITGIAITDPNCDGKQTFRCGHCDVEHDVDEKVASILYETFLAHRLQEVN